MIRPDRVTKIAGELAPLPRNLTEHLATLAAVICIDERGAVKSTRLLGDVPGAVRDAVTRDLRGFRFSPYLEGGVATPACFTRPLAVGASRR